MTREEFNKTRFSAGMLFSYDGKDCPVISVDFIEALFGLNAYGDPENIQWVRCESGDLVEPQKQLTEI